MADIQDVCGDRFSIGGLGVSMQLTYGKLVKQVFKCEFMIRHRLTLGYPYIVFFVYAM